MSASSTGDRRPTGNKPGNLEGFRRRTPPLILQAIRHLFDHRCWAKEKCPHLSPEERAAFDAWMDEWLRSVGEEPMTTVREKYNITYACWQSSGGCLAFHGGHIHVSVGPAYQQYQNKPGYQPPKCMGGSAGFSAPGSPDLVAFETEVRRRFPQLGSQSGKFNCRLTAGTTKVSDHAYWKAIDIFPPDKAYGDKVYAWINGPWTDGQPPEEEEDFMPALSDEQQKDMYVAIQALLDGALTEQERAYFKEGRDNTEALQRLAKHLGIDASEGKPWADQLGARLAAAVKKIEGP